MNGIPVRASLSGRKATALEQFPPAFQPPEKIQFFSADNLVGGGRKKYRDGAENTCALAEISPPENRPHPHHFCFFSGRFFCSICLALLLSQVAALPAGAQTPGVTILPDGCITVPDVDVCPIFYEGDGYNITAALASRPTSAVTLTFAASNSGTLTIDADAAASGDQSALTIAPDDWEDEHVITISGNQDRDVLDGVHNISVRASGGGYDNTLVETMRVFVNDTDYLKVRFRWSGAFSVSENGSHTFEVRLDRKAYGDVELKFRDGYEKVVSVIPGRISFDGNNWNTWQTVTVTGLDDLDAIDNYLNFTGIGHPKKTNIEPNNRQSSSGNSGRVNFTVTDDDSYSFVFNRASLLIHEGHSTDFTVALSAKPNGNVTVEVSPHSSAAATLRVDTNPSASGNQDSLTFNADNWNIPQSVRVQSVNDASPQDYASSINLRGNGGGLVNVSASLPLTVRDRLARTGFLVQPTHLMIPEGGSRTFTVRMHRAPSVSPSYIVLSKVAGGSSSVTFDTDPNTPGNQSNLTFTSSNWGTDQTVTVSGLEDSDKTTDSATINVTGITGNYANVTDTVTVSVIDNDSDALLSTTLNEGSSTAVLIPGTPFAQGLVSVESISEAVATVSPSYVIFPTSNDAGWARPVTITGVRDADALDETTMIRLTQGAVSRDINVSVTDLNEQALRLSTSSLSLSEGGSGSFTVKLGSQPAGDSVRVSFAVTRSNSVGVDADPGRAGNQSSITFNASDWDTARTVNVFSSQDTDAGDEAATVTLSASGADYGGISNSVSVSVTDDDSASLGISPGRYIWIDEGGDRELTVILNTPPNDTVKVSLALSDGGSPDITIDDTDPDTEGAQSELTFTTSNWNEEQKVTMRAADDPDAVADSSTLTLTGSGGGYDGVSDSHTVFVTENDTTGLRLSPGSLSVGEGGSKTFTVALATQPSNTVTITVTPSDDSSADVSVDTDSEATGSQNQLTFTTANWSAAQTVTVLAAQDNDTVQDDAVLNVTAGGGDYGGVSGSVSVSVADDDSPGLTLAPGALTVVEEDSNAFSVVLNTQPSASVTVTVAATGTANPDVSFDTDSAAGGNQDELTFTTSNWNTAQRVTVSAAGDPDGLDDSAELRVTASGGGYAGISKDIAVTVTDNDPPALVLSPAALTVGEGADSTFTAALATRPSGTVTVSVARASGGSPDVSFDTDPNAAGGQGRMTFTTDSWNTAQTVTVSALDDDDTHLDRATLTLSASGGDYAGVSRDIEVTVTENDTPGLTLSASALTITEGAGRSFTAVLDSEPSAAVTVNLSIAGSRDVTADTAVLNFTASNWDTPQSVTVSAAHDDDAEGESAIVTLSAIGAEYAGLNSSLSVTVTEDDEVGLTLAPGALTVKEGASGSFTVVLDTRPSANVEVSLRQPDPGGNSDVTFGPATLNFTTANWGSPQAVTVSGLHDDDAIADTATINLTAAGGDYAGETGSLSVRVTEDDQVGLTLSPGALAVREEADADFTVKLDTEPTGTVTVSVARLAGGSSDVTFDTDSATGGDQSQLTFTTSNWSTAQSVKVSAADDADAVEDRAVLRLTASGGGYSGAAGSVSRDIEVTVTENDTTDLTLSPGALTVGEGGNGSFSVLLSTAPSAAVTVSVARLAGGSADVSFDTDADTQGDQNQLTFTTSNWEDAQTVTVSAAEDDDALGDSAKLRLTAAGGGYGSGSEAVSKDIEVTVTENDAVGLTLSASSLSVGEGGGRSFTVALTTRPSAAVTVSLSAAGSSTVSIGAASLSFTTDNWSAPQSVTVNAAHDADADNETATVSLSAAGGDYAGQTAGVSVSVVDDDTAALTITPGSLRFEEGRTGTFTVALATRPSAAVSVSLEQPDPGGNADVTFSPTSLDFTTANWGTVQTVTVSAGHDDDAIADAATINLSASGGGYGSAAGSVSVTVTDDDTVGLTLSPGALTVAEGGEGSFTVKLDSEPSATVTLSVARLAGGSPDVTFDSNAGTEGAQHQLTFTTANWGAEQSVAVYAADDLDAIADSAVLRLTASGGGYSGAAGSVSSDITVTVTEDDTIGLTLSPGSLSFEEGASGSFTVALTTQPSASVTVEVAQTGAANSDVTLDTDPDTSGNQNELTFTTDNWSTPQGVTVSAIEDDDALADSAELRLTASGGGYSNATENVSQDISVTVTEKDTADLVLSVSSLTVTEGTGGSFTVALATQPSAAVTVNLGVAGSNDVSIGAAVLDFTTDNWGTAQSVTVEAAHDEDADGESATISLRAAGGDYAGQTDSVSVTVTDDDTASLTISPATLTITEGADGTFTVALDTRPSAAVSVSLEQPDPGGNSDVSFTPTSLDFTTTNWGTPRTVTVSAIHDDDAAQDTAAINLSASGGGYGSAAGSVSVKVTDDDTVGLALSPGALTVQEGSNGSFTVALATKPGGTVTVSVAPTGEANADVTFDTDAGTAGNQSELTFTTSNWDTVQEVTVHAAEDDDALEDSAKLRLTAAGSDYAGVSRDISVTVTENDAADLIFSKSSLDLDEGGTGSFTVELKTRPSGSVTVTVERTAGGSADVTFDTDPVTTGDQSRLTFTTSNWNTAQEVTVSAAEDDDALDDSAELHLTAAGGGYSNETDSVSKGISVTVDENDSAALTLSSNSLTLEEGTSASFTVELATRPSAAVTVGLNVTGSDDVRLNSSALVFSTDNWKSAQTVTVSAAEDDDAIADSARISLTAIGGDYTGQTARLSVSVTENDSVSLEISKSALRFDEGASESFTVALGSQPSAGVSVSLVQLGISNPDISIAPSSLSFTTSNWSTAQAVTVSAIRDTDAIAERATIRLSASGGGYGSAGGDVSVSVVETDAVGLKLSQRSLDVDEGVDESFTVALNTQPSSGVTVRLSRSGSSDVTLGSTVLNFTRLNWSAPQSVSVEVAEDDDSQDENATISLSASGGDYASVSDSISVSVEDNDATELVLSTGALSVSEGGGQSFDVALSTRPSTAVTVDLTRAGSDDVSFSPASLSFTTSNWGTAKSVRVSAREDADIQADRASITLTASGGDYVGVTGSVAVTVVDNDRVGLVLSVPALTIAEGGSERFTVKLATQPSANVTVSLTRVSGGSPDVTLSSASLSFTDTDWNTEQTVTVSAAEDDDAIADRATISISAEGGDYDGQSGSISVSVTENDTAALTLSKTSLEFDEGEDGSFTVALATQPSGGVTVNLAISGDDDVTLDAPSLVFTSTNWSTVQTVTVSGAHDNDALDDRASVSLSASGQGYGGIVASVSVKVEDDDEVGLDVSASSLRLSEGGSASFSVALDTRPSAAVTVTLGQSGAVNPDVSLSPASLSFTTTNWSTAQDVTVSAIRDPDAVQDSATVSLTASGADYDGVTGSLGVTVTDLDTINLALSASSLTVDEGDDGSFTVALATRPSSPVSVSLTLTGADSSDLTLSAASLSFSSSNWNVAQPVTVTAAEDADAAEDRAAVSLAAAGGGYDGITGSVSVKVTDNDVTGLDISEDELTLVEGSGGSFTVALDTRPSAAVTVTLRASGAAASDVTLSAASLSFTASSWEAPQTVTLTVGEDADALAERATVSLSAAGGDYEGVRGSVSVRVTDNDTPALSLSKNALPLNEGGSGEFTVRLATQPISGVTVNLTRGGSNDVTLGRTLLSFTTQNWSAPQSVSVSAAWDADSQDDTATISLSAAGGGYGEATGSVTVTVADSSAIGLVLSERSLSFGEGAGGSFTVRLNTQPSAAVTVRSAQSGTVNDDVTVSPASLNFSVLNWSAPQRVTVSAIRDADARDEDVTVSLSASGGDYAGASGSVSVTVDDLDRAGLALSVRDGRLALGEGDSESFTVVLSSRPSDEVTVQLARDGSGDVSVSPVSLSFSASDWSRAQTVTVSAIHDPDAVDDSATVSLTASGGDYAGASAAVSVTVTDDETVSLTLSETSLEVEEGDSQSFTVALATRPSEDVTVSLVQPANTDVTADADINALGIQDRLIFTPSDWSTARTVLVRAGQDADALADSAEVGLRAAGGDYDGLTARVKVEVEDDDGVGIRVLPNPLTVREGDSPVRMRVALETQPSAPVTLTLSQTGSINNDVEFDTDAGRPGSQSTLSFTSLNWSQLQEVEISAKQDADSVNDAASILLSAQGGDYVGVAKTVTVSVTDDDKPNLVASERELTVREGSSASFTVVLSNRPSGNVTVALARPAGGEVTLDGDAVRGGVQETVVFTDQNWNQARIVTVAAAHDDDGIDDILTLSLAVSGGTPEYAGARAGVVLTVDDDDIPGLSVSPGSLEITEGESSSFSVALTTEPSSNVVVSIAQAANDDIEFDTDASTPGNQGVLHFNPQNWSTARMVSVTARQDVDSQNDTETLRLSSSGAAYNNRRASVEITVEDDDRPELEVSLNGLEISEALTLDEGEGRIIGVRLLSRPSSSVEVTVASADAGAVTANPASLSFTQGDWGAVQSVTVTGAQDADSVDERVRVGLKAAGGDYDGVSAALEVVVEDDETAGLSLSVSELTVVEGQSEVFTVALNHLPVGDVTVALGASGGAASVSPVQLTFTPDNWSSVQEVSVSGIEDDDTQDAEDAVQLAASGGGYDGVSGRIGVAVRDDDTPGLVLSTPALSVPEGGASSFMVSLATRPGEAVQVSVSVTGADAGLLLFVPDQLGFTGENWSQPQVVTVLGLDDPNARDDVSVLSLSGSGADYGGVTVQLEVTVVDDDESESARPEEIEAAENVLEEIGRALLGGSVDVITRRFDAPAGGRAEADVGGAEVEVGGEGSFERMLLGALQHFGGSTARMPGAGPGGAEQLGRLGSIRLEDGRPLRIERDAPEQSAPLLREFTYPLGGLGGETTAWMRYNQGEFSGELRGLGQRYDGAQDAIWAGIDQRFASGLLFGAAVSQGAGDARYAVSSLSERVSLDTELLMVMPYLEVPVRSGLMNLILGFGSGDIESRETDGAHSEAHLSVQMFSLGSRWPLARLGGRFALSLTGSIGSSRLVTTCSTGDLLCGLSVSSGRIHAGVEVVHEGISTDGSWSVTPRYALSLRQDSGRQSSGAGAELSGSVRLAAPGDRFSIDAGLRWLGMHATEGYEEWSASVELQLKSRDAAGRGLTLGLGPQWGTLESGVLERDGVFGPDPRGPERARGAAAASGRAAMRASAGYGVDLWAGLLTPFAEYSVSGGEAASSRLQGGLRYRSGESLEGRLFGEWEAGQYIQPRSRIGLELSRRF